MSTTEQDRNRELVRGAYEALLVGDITVLKGAVGNDFEVHVTPAVPWGGVHRGVEALVTNVLPHLAAVIDFASMRLTSISADGDNVAALLTARSTGGDEIWLSEHWTLLGGKIASLRTFYFDARALQSSPPAAAS